MASNAHSTVIPFPPRPTRERTPNVAPSGGNNVHYLCGEPGHEWATALKHMAAASQHRKANAAPMSPELLLSLLILDASDSKTKRVVRQNIESYMAEGSDAATQLDWWTRHLPNTVIQTGDQEINCRGTQI